MRRFYLTIADPGTNKLGDPLVRIRPADQDTYGMAAADSRRPSEHDSDLRLVPRSYVVHEQAFDAGDWVVVFANIQRRWRETGELGTRRGCRYAKPIKTSARRSERTCSRRWPTSHASDRSITYR